MIARLQNIWLARLAVTLAGLGLVWVVGLLQPSATRWLDDGLRDMMTRFAAQDGPENRVAIVDIDEESLTEIGAWPWRRGQLADLIEHLLVVQQASGVGLDVVFPQTGEADGDTRLATLAQHTPLVFAQVLDYVDRHTPLVQGELAGGKAPSHEPGLAKPFGFIANHAGFNAAPCVGNIGYVPDPDGTLRHLPIYSGLNGLVYESLAKAMLNCFGKGPERVLTNEHGLWRVPYRYKQEAYMVISAAAILKERLPPGSLQGRYVLIGSSALGLGDQVSTPLSPLTAGVMVHAAALSGLLDLHTGQVPEHSDGSLWMLLWSVLTFALALVVFTKVAAWSSVVWLCAMSCAWIVVSYLAFQKQVEWSPTAPLLGYAWLLLAVVPLEWWQAQKSTRRLMTTLSHYVAQPVLQEIVRRNLRYSLEPSLQNVTVLVADMEGYTRTTSSMALTDAAALTKSFLGCLTRPVLDTGGTLDRYSGDGLVAFWGAPLPCDHAEDQAVNAALAMLDEIATLNHKLTQLGQPPVQVRIGIESGTAMVGDLGTEFRSTYTAVGDCINFASRLESEARHLGTSILVGPRASGALNKHQTVSLGTLQLRNTDTFIEVFTLRQLKNY